jgi:hypothetical protein
MLSNKYFALQVEIIPHKAAIAQMFTPKDEFRKRRSAGTRDSRR